MFHATERGESRWYVVNGEDKKRARLNVIAHLLSFMPYNEIAEPELSLPDRQKDNGYVRPPRSAQTYVPEIH